VVPTGPAILTFASISNPQVTALQRAAGSHTDSTTGFNAPAAGDDRDPDQFRDISQVASPAAWRIMSGFASMEQTREESEKTMAGLIESEGVAQVSD
jgi:hypothetical protein